MINKSIHIALFIAFTCLCNVTIAQDENTSYFEASIVKTYPDGKSTGYFRLTGTYSLKNLHRIEQVLLNEKDIIRASIFDKSDGASTHTVNITYYTGNISENEIKSRVNDYIKNELIQK